MEFLWIGLVLINLYGLIIMAFDKQKAIKGQWRTPEKHLWLVTCFGGSLGIWLGMKLYRHKTKHRSFKIGVPVCFFIQVGLVLWGLIKLG